MILFSPEFMGKKLVQNKYYLTELGISINLINMKTELNPRCFQMYVIVLSDLLLKWSKKDGFYTSFQVTGGLFFAFKTM